MRKLFFVLCSVLMLSNIAKAQKVENGVLISWDDAQGVITIPDNVTEIAANCFYQEGEPDDEGWGTSDPISNTNIKGVNLNILGKYADRCQRQSVQEMRYGAELDHAGGRRNISYRF